MIKQNNNSIGCLINHGYFIKKPAEVYMPQQVNVCMGKHKFLNRIPELNGQIPGSFSMTVNEWKSYNRS